MDSNEGVEGKIKLPSGYFSEKALEALADISAGKNNKYLEEEPDYIKELIGAGLVRGYVRFLRPKIYVKESRADEILLEYKSYKSQKNNSSQK